MNIVLFGPQGSGKGTQALLLCQKFGFFYFESGAYLRKIAETHPSLKKSLDEGNLVPDKEMTSYLTAFFDEKNLYDDILFDGFPRTVEQYRFLKNWLVEKQVKIDLGLVLEISEEETIKRLLLRKRDDDTSEAIKKRLSLYRNRTEILINEIKKDTKIIEVDGERSIEDIQKDLIYIVENVING
ncbi:MAG: nucleoside monophosphate kinase [Candidatus Woesebacteria bacterium]|nr:nucleoside monophosphate kinase [Candidatus Woesebacteria bacterium]